MVVGTGRHRIGGGEEKGVRGSKGFGFGLGFGFGRRGVEWSGVEWRGRVNNPRMTTGQNEQKGNEVAN